MSNVMEEFHRAVSVSRRKQTGGVSERDRPPRRVQIIEELRGGETDVGSLKGTLGISHSNVSQHLAVLRAHRIVAERREGRQVFYRLCSSELAEWLVDSMRFVPEATEEYEEVKNALRNAKLA